MENTVLFEELKRITDKDTLREMEIRKLKRVISGTSGKTLLDSERKELNKRLLYKLKSPYKVTGVQGKKGLEFLKDMYMSPTGQVRKSNPFKPKHIKMLSEYSHFTFDGFKEVKENLVKYESMYAPVYTLHTKTNGSFSYYGAQEGGTFNFVFKLL